MACHEAAQAERPDAFFPAVEALTVTHVFQLASITKQFTAAAVLALVQDGRLDLDVPITRYLPDVPIQWRPITVRQLLSHTSSIPDYARVATHCRTQTTRPAPDTLLGLVAATPFYFAPSDQMR